MRGVQYAARSLLWSERRVCRAHASEEERTASTALAAAHEVAKTQIIDGFLLARGVGERITFQPEPGSSTWR